MNSTLSTLERLRRPRLLVLGDLMLDRYTWGKAERVSPEAPVLVLQADDEEIRTGGAASVATLARALEADVAVAGVVGNDPEGQTLIRLLADESIDTALVFVDPDRPTTTKERFVGRAADRHAHQILRVDRESRVPLNSELERRLGAALIGRLDHYDALLISDYAKGVCTRQILGMVLAAARSRALPVLVDPARTTDWSGYQGATLLKPNRLEAELASGQPINTPEDALHVGEEICRRFGCAGVLVTLDRDGMALTLNDDISIHFPVSPREVYDITGAGDMTLAMLGVCLGSGQSLHDAVPLANAAAGVEVQRMGVAPVTRADLRKELVREATDCRSDGRRLAAPRSKVVTLSEAAALSQAYRAQGKRVVFSNGCFDLLHVGHVFTLQEAARLGDVLFVAINSDASVRALKGDDRPVVNEHDRATMLSALDCVDHVLVFDEPTPHELLREIRPDILVKGGTTDAVVGHEVVENYGGRVHRVGNVEGVSTTELLASIHRPADAPLVNTS